MIVIGLAVLVILGLLVYAVGFKTPNTAVDNTPATNTNQGTQTGTTGQNPSVSLAFSNALTKQSISAAIVNYKDAVTGNFLGASPSLAKDQQVIALVNGSGYISAIQPVYTVLPGNQQLQGSLYQFANQTIQIYNNAGTGLIGGSNGATGNDSISTTLVNNKIVLTGNTYKSSGKIFIVYEIGSTTNISGATLTLQGSNTAIGASSVPNCYTNSLTGTPFRAAWEVPAIVGGTQAVYNLQTVSANGNQIAGQAYLTMYNEHDAFDTLTGASLTSGICDSGNTAYYTSYQANNYWFK